MKQFVNVLFILFFVVIGYAQKNEALKIESRNFKRLYKISDGLYRSEQPSRKGFLELDAIGVKSVLNLRRGKNDNKKATGLDLDLQQLKLKAKEMDKDDLIHALDIINTSEKPVLVHCWHGSDRTGAIVAAYRIVFENWSKEDAIAEFRQPEFGYHENWYGNLIELLNNLNVAEIQSELDLRQ
ncbi:dual specificity protein phosphatase family protein [Muricauda sp. 334s03]|uniref:diphosphoinositol-polyphosphate diphosphatase n=1 Tax=Flagellimonas yonaguniensis TaxID=3031325 RepID=A0ABT5Y472_9FLAO|nr:dual specificity protein phosphatase family protein [[Muricauda] yonaguniensis]MDF0718252.1 dual specificity protein phosphatase family protein [[Muricauda] yonaguniensis]